MSWGWKSKRSISEQSSDGGGGGWGYDGRVVSSSTYTSYRESSGAESAGTEAWCGGVGERPDRRFPFNAKKDVGPEAQKSKLTRMCDASGELTIASGNSNKKGGETDENEDEDGLENSDESSDDGVGEDTSLADITECLDCIGEVNWARFTPSKRGLSCSISCCWAYK